MKYLFIVSKYGYDIQTNGLVLNNIIDEIIKDGNEVVCLSESNSSSNYEYKGVKVYTVQQGIHLPFKKNNKYFERMYEIAFQLCFYFSYPSYDKITERRMHKKICELDKQYEFDCIFAIYRKFTNVNALIRYKKEKEKSKCAILFFDLMEANRPKCYSKHFFTMICRKQYEQISSIVDKVYIPNDGKCEFENVIPQEKKGVLYYPGFVKRKTIMKKELVKNSHVINMLFAGTLDLKYRNPMPLFVALKGLKDKGYSIKLEIYGKGNCGDIIASAKEEFGLDIQQKGTIAKEQLLIEYQKVDVLVNISNNNIKATPSKVFELLSTGKPIINIVYNKSDNTKQIFDKYMMAYNMLAYENISSQIDGLVMFLEHAHDLSEDEYANVESKFINYTPYNVYQSIKNF